MPVLARENSRDQPPLTMRAERRYNMSMESEKRTTFQLAVLVLALIAVCAGCELARGATTYVRFHIPTMQGDTLNPCLPGASRATTIDSVRLVGFPRVKGWQWWPRGWYVPQPRTLSQKAVAPFKAGTLDSLPVTLPNGSDSTFSTVVQSHNRVGWSCYSNGHTASVEK